jgi:hypothetical protein
MYSGINRLVGTGKYTTKVYRKNGTLVRSVTNHAYNWNSTDIQTKYFRVFTDVANGGAGDGDGDYADIVLSLDNPTSNPLSTFDVVPFDTWMQRISDSAEFHIYDPDTNDYGLNVIQVPGDDPSLPSVPLNFGIVIPKTTWTQPYNGKKLWKVYPDFVEYGKTYRSREVKNVNWYDNGPYNPN